MAGHLLNTFSNTPNTPSIITSGAMSFDARMYGAPSPMQNPLFGFTPLSEDSTTAKQIATLQAKLNKKLGPEYISQRPGPGGGQKLTYAEGWRIINLANEVFGFNGWSSSVVSVATDFVDCIEESKRFNVGVTAIVRVTLRDGAYHEDVGYGMLENAKSKGAALDKCKKEAITDALKRTLRNFGNLLGNCLYDKSYAQEVVKIKVPPAKLDKNELYRRPEFQETVPPAPPPAPRGQPMDLQPSTRREEPSIKVERENHEPETPITYVPRHLRQEMAAAAERAQVQTPTRAAPLQGAPPRPHAPTTTPGPGSNTIGANRGPSPVDAPKPNGLVTPIQTPIRPPLPRAPPSRTVATSTLARMRSAPERSVSFTEPVPVDVPAGAESADATDNAGRGNDQVVDDDDGFPLSTQDGAFFAAVDLGDADLGRPIDFDEGAGGVNMTDKSLLEQEPEHQHQHQVRRSSVGSTSGGPSHMNVRNEPQVQPAKPPSGSGVQGQLQPRHAPPNGTSSASTSSTSGARTGPPAQDIKRPMPSSMGGLHYPSGTKPPSQQHIPRPMPACVRTNPNTPQSGPTNSLKRSADAMQTGSAPSTSARPPIQGMGLAQRQQQQRDAIVRRPSDNSESNDPKRLKR